MARARARLPSTAGSSGYWMVTAPGSKPFTPRAAHRVAKQVHEQMPEGDRQAARDLDKINLGRECARGDGRRRERLSP